jgi:phenylacetate-coenzyme A ligase PaaK-like adenylate-forming protein
MLALDELFQAPQYSLPSVEKETLLMNELADLTQMHYEGCLPYKQVLDGLNLSKSLPSFQSIQELPSLPVRLFKLEKLKSIPYDKVFKILKSSGTTSQALSQIVLDKETAKFQTKSLITIVTSFIGKNRLPMILIDSASTLKDRTSFSARGAGLLGMSNFGRNHFYALNAQMELELDGLMEFIGKYPNQPILLFGFTFMVWQYFYQELKRLGVHLDLKQAILIHSGGWKKLQEQSVSNTIFKTSLLEQTGIPKIYNFYGMVEQVGSIFMECEQGFLHTPNFAEILIRDYRDWKCLPIGEKGIIQTLSVLPRSYPGHSLLTEDLGIIHGIDDCSCGRKGIYFTVEGRIPKMELRGCSDTHAQTILG